jgi:hypothetical protein
MLAGKGGTHVKQARATFKVAGWDETPGEQIPGGHALGRAVLKKTFHGDLEGSSTVEMLMSKGADGSAAYVAMERIDARIGDRTGTFVLMHAATSDATGQHGDWRVVPGSGTGGLAGLRGTGAIQHDASGATFTLDYEIDP